MKKKAWMNKNDKLSFAKWWNVGFVYERLENHDSAASKWGLIKLSEISIRGSAFAWFLLCELSLM